MCLDAPQTQVQYIDISHMAFLENTKFGKRLVSDNPTRIMKKSTCVVLGILSYYI